MSCDDCILDRESGDRGSLAFCQNCLHGASRKGYCVAVEQESAALRPVVLFDDEFAARQGLQRLAHNGTAGALLRWRDGDGGYVLVARNAEHLSTVLDGTLG